MSKQFAVMHTEKGSGSGGGLGNHIDRIGDPKIYYPHANPEQKDLNIEVKTKFSHLSLSEGINKRISEGYQGKRKIRTDAVRFLKTVLSGSPDQMKKIQNSGDLTNWINANIEFMKSEYGSKNILKCVVHLDEKTPHLHVVHVPLTSDGRLSAKEIMGNKIHLQKRQDRYAAAMSYFGLERGVRNSGVTHTDTKDYYNEVQYVNGDVSNLTVNGFLGVDKSKTIENLQKALKSSKMENKMLLKKYKNQSEKLKANSNFKIALDKKEKAWKNKTKEWKDFTTDLLKNPNKYEILRKDYLESQKKKTENKRKPKR